MSTDDDLFDVLARLALHYGWRLEKMDPGPCQDGACNYNEGHDEDHCYCVHTTAGECVYTCLAHDSEVDTFSDVWPDERRGNWEPGSDLESWAKMAGIVPWDERMGPL